MKRTSCGIIILNAEGELLLGHASGTANWDIPKGGRNDGESTLQAALRETVEETGLQFHGDDLIELGRFDYRPEKELHLYSTLIERIDPRRCHCRTRFRDWRGRMQPEMDSYEWARFKRVPNRCARSMAALLTQKLSLPELLQRLLDAGRVAVPAFAEGR